MGGTAKKKKITAQLGVPSATPRAALCPQGPLAPQEIREAGLQQPRQPHPAPTRELYADKSDRKHSGSQKHYKIKSQSQKQPK